MGGRNRKRPRRELSQAEIWDDSALVQSWDDALAEYKKYHSIHARGERVEDAIKAFESDDPNTEINLDPPVTSSTGAPEATPADHQLEDLEDGELDEMDQHEAIDERQGQRAIEAADEATANGIPQSEAHKQNPYQKAPSQQALFPSMPAAAIVGVNNEALKNLMMSWYYAGYYTGFYEGQNAAANTAAA